MFAVDVLQGGRGVTGGNQLDTKEECTAPKPNISWEDFKAIKKLREDSSRVILITDKGVAKVVKDYITKVQCLLEDKETYSLFTMDPTSRLKSELIVTLWNIKATGGLKDFQYKRHYPTRTILPKFYGLSKIHSVGPPHALCIQ